uniref:DNA-directed RNA polymerase n=1 Tax=Clavaria fumosa TaxID=264083 RepID=A0A7T3PCQ4_9AGAR|nr:DNA-dependent RNA polymerase [Clavaria fumosa]QPZ51106.1 DNA-dependent RNA polymerase [Clavaria fumosa]
MDPEFILKAENKFVFTAFCLSMRELNKNHNYKIKIPVFLDATCSWIQHLADVRRDLHLASEVNLVPQNDSIPPSDIYNTLREPLNDRIRQFGRDNPLYSNLSLINLSRNDLKPSIMTTTYNVTQRGVKDQFITRLKMVKENKNKNKNILLPSINGDNISISLPELDKIAEIIHKANFKIYPSLDVIYKYFINMTKVLNKLEIPVILFTPCGLEIIQNYYVSKQNKVAINFAGKTKKMVIKEWIKKVDKNKQRGGIIPNIIHSLDA